MTDYTRTQNFTAMAGTDSLPSVFDTEFNAVATASATKADSSNPTFSGTVTVPALAAAVSHAGDALKVSPAQSSEVYMHAFPTGTKMTFYQATAPLGWTQDTTAALNDALLRTVTAGGGGTGGTNGFVAAPLTATASHTLTISEMPAHTHTAQRQTAGQAYVAGGGSNYDTVGNTGSTGGNAGHTHNIAWTPKYVDLIVCTKD